MRKTNLICAVLLGCGLLAVPVPVSAQSIQPQGAIKTEESAQPSGEWEEQETDLPESPIDSEIKDSPEQEPAEDVTEESVTETPESEPTEIPDDSPQETLEHTEEDDITTDLPRTGAETTDEALPEKSEGWKELADGCKYFAADENGNIVPVTGFQDIDGRTYLFDSSGCLMTGWQDIDGRTLYFKKTGEFGIKGALLTGIQNINSKTYYFRKDGEHGIKGEMMTGWQDISGKTYYFKRTGVRGVKGVMLTGWQSINGRKYYFKKTGARGVKGVLLTGIQNINSITYFFCSTGAHGDKGEMLTGWQDYKGSTFFFKRTGETGIKGKMFTGFQTIDGKKYYFKRTGDRGVKGRMFTGFQTISGNRYFFKRSGSHGVKGQMFFNWQTLNGRKYYFGTDGKMRCDTTVDGIYLGPEGAASSPRTLKGLFQMALKPVGSTLYVLGGGHQQDATRIGLNPGWTSFFNQQDSSYESTWPSVSGNGKGLDCSGYIGWTVYNVINDVSGQTSCSYVSYQIPGQYEKRGWGTLMTEYKDGDFSVGDVVAWRAAHTGHVWFILGKCEDGSYVILHTTTAGGAQISGTIASSGNPYSQAASLAETYMNRYYPKLGQKITIYPMQPAPDYVYGPGDAGLYRFSWDLSGDKLLSDPEGYSDMSAEEILEDLFAS